MQFIAASVGIVAAGVLVAFPFLGEGPRRTVLGAGALALGTQIPAHLLLKSWRNRKDRFAAAVGIGFAWRVVVIVLGIVLVVLPGRAGPVSFIVSLGGFLVAILFVETWLEHRRRRVRAASAGS